MASEDIGSIGDRPIQALNDDQLGIKDYATALRQFVTECDTPLTVGIQGDWGSGKTSLMNLMRPKPDDKAFTSVWINTWKYQQLGDPEVLFLAVLSGIVDELCKEAPKGAKELGKIALGLISAGSKMLGRLAIASRGVDPDKLMADEKIEPHQLADKLKHSLRALVANVTQKQRRVLLFIDDLDRIRPQVAVQILEALKNFLDVPNLVTILACDYAVISRGLEGRVGVSEEALGRSFFDKIIQVPFRMPTHQYDAKGFVQNLLKRVKVNCSDGEADLLCDLLRLSIGLNPRGLKRQANTLLLLMRVAEQSQEKKKLLDHPRAKLILMTLTAMEAKYQPLHRYLAYKLADPIDADALRKLLDQKHPQLPDRGQEPWVAEFLDDDDEEGERITPRLQGFLSHFGKLIDHDGNGKLDNKELRILAQLMSLSAISSVGESETPRGRGAQYHDADTLLQMARENGVGDKLNRFRSAMLRITHASRYFAEGRTKSTFKYLMNVQHWAPHMAKSRTNMFSVKVTAGPSGSLVAVWNPYTFERIPVNQRPAGWDDFVVWVRTDRQPAYRDKNGWETWEILLADNAAIDDFIRRVVAAYNMPVLPA